MHDTNSGSLYDCKTKDHEQIRPADIESLWAKRVLDYDQLWAYIWEAHAREKAAMHMFLEDLYHILGAYLALYNADPV